MFTDHEIEQRFGHTAASIELKDNPKEQIHANIRAAFKDLAKDLDERIPDSRQKTKAFEELETASMWFHKSLAHNP